MKCETFQGTLAVNTGLALDDARDLFKNIFACCKGTLLTLHNTCMTNKVSKAKQLKIF